MDSNTLLAICLVALITVFILLGLLALVISLITRIFPAPGSVSGGTDDAAMMAAIATAIAARHPSARISKIEEQR